MPRNGTSVAADAAIGALAGAAATWVMNRVTTYMYEHEDREVRRREDEARGNRTAYVAAAEKTAGLVGKELGTVQRARLGAAFHWGIGIGAGALYGALRGRVRGIDLAEGAVFGTALWLLVDEAAVALLGLSPGPKAFPWQAHARGLAGHLTYGVVADQTLELAERLT